MKKINPLSATKASKRGFTLIELLVVIAIIGILASIISPALSTAKMKAVSAKCQANMRSLATGLRSYADGNDGMLPSPTGNNPGGDGLPWSKGKFFRTICPNINPSNKTTYAPLDITDYGHIFDTVFECPAARLVGAAEKGDPQSGRSYGYAMNMRMALPPANCGHEHMDELKSVASIARPSSCMMLTDSSEQPDIKGNNPDPGAQYGMRGASVRHNGNANCAFVDGHVAALDPYEWEDVPGEVVADIRQGGYYAAAYFWLGRANDSYSYGSPND